MASGGMSNVWKRIIGVLMMQIVDNFNTGCTTAYIHGAAADIMFSRHGQLGLPTNDLFLPL